MADNGVKEVVLTGVNLGTYLSEEVDFLGLLEKLSSIKELSRIRISSVEPTTIPEEIFQWMADESHPLMPYLHVPLQSGCDSVLKRMKRRYNLAEMSEFFSRAKSTVPDICLGTDLMVGFPGETEEDFHETCNTFLNFPLDYCHVFTFSERKGTPAAKIYDQVPMDGRRKRSAHLRRISASKRMDFFKSQEGKEMRVLFENPKDGVLAGFTDNYIKVFIKSEDNSLANKFAHVVLKEANPEFVLGELK
jgi:threonylcarbamoyladenosine tRNA methylthiotransferase MtaB